MYILARSDAVWETSIALHMKECLKILYCIVFNIEYGGVKICYIFSLHNLPFTSLQSVTYKYFHVNIAT